MQKSLCPLDFRDSQWGSILLPRKALPAFSLNDHNPWLCAEWTRLAAGFSETRLDPIPSF